MQYRHEIMALYDRQNFIGSIFRQLIAPPTTVVRLPKRTLNGFTSGCEKRLPPRLSLRPLANYTFLSSISFGMFIAWITKYVILIIYVILLPYGPLQEETYAPNIFSYSYGPFAFLGFVIWVWIMYIIIRAALQHCFPSSTRAFRPDSSEFHINRWLHSVFMIRTKLCFHKLLTRIVSIDTIYNIVSLICSRLVQAQQKYNKVNLNMLKRTLKGFLLPGTSLPFYRKKASLLQNESANWTAELFFEWFILDVVHGGIWTFYQNIMYNS